MSLPPARPVGKGSHLAIVAPAGPFDKEAFLLGVDWLCERYHVSYSPEIFTKSGYFAGSDDRRLSELRQAIENPDVDAILCARGGYGATRILPGLDLEAIRAANKTIVGFSDITALHNLWAEAGVRSIHAPMVAALGKASEAIRTKWIEALEHPETERKWHLKRIDGGANGAEGVLVGGNLAVLGALNGTPFTPKLKGKILFLEDVGERPYRIDRMLTTLKQSGWFDVVSGVVLGAFTEGDPGPDGTSVDDVFCEHFSELDCPVLAGLSAGHISENVPLNFGAPAKIVGDCLIVNP
ncbi:MAG: LD-carboxypeptidase [Verrucomicrobiales bacterium]|nr:LD-carboxypeptidase [Verrucomicrobiales bacterium]